MTEQLNFSQIYGSPIVEGKQYFSDFFSFEVNLSKDDVFKVVSNTSLVNKKLDFAPRFEEERDGELYVKTKMIGKELEWIERPWRWSYGKYIVSHRIHTKALYKVEFAVIHLEEVSLTKTKVTFFYEALLKNSWMKWILGLTYQKFGKKYAQVVIDLCENKKNIEIDKSNPLIQSLVIEFKKIEIPSKVAEVLAHLIIDEADEDVFKIQVPKLSKEWNIPVEELLKSLLMASQKGYFELCWDTVCPHCKGARSRSLHLEDLLFKNSCDPCDLTFELDDIDYIDVTFKINDKVRKVPNVSFCAAEPYKKSHIYFQENINSDKEAILELNLEIGSYRARILGLRQTYVFQVTHNKSHELLWDCRESHLVKNIGGNLILKIKNSLNSKKTIVVEKIVPPLNYLSPITVFNSSIFRKVYASETIAKGIQLKLPEQIILFTDVVDSTKFYQRVGDKEAFRQIKLHFDVVEEIMIKRNGIIIKTIGDAIMATFKSVEDVFKVSREICEALNSHPEIDFKMRLSVHKGPMIAVNYNTGVDYFGDNVNISAKLQAISEANEIAFSQEILDDILKVLPNLKYEQKTFLEGMTGYLSSVYNL